MMTPPSESVLAALGRADVGELSAGLDAQACTPGVLRRLLRHDAPRVRQLGLVRLTELVTVARSGGGAGPAELAELARLLPASLDGRPEAALLQARLHLRLRRYLRPGGVPPWRAAGLPARVQIAWLCAEIADRPAAIRDEPAGELLYQAVRGIAADDVDDPSVLVVELMSGADPVLCAEALRVVREALYGALLTPARARAHVADLAGVAHAEVAAAALRELAEPWAALDPFPPERLRRFLRAAAAEPEVADAVIEAAARHGHADVLWDLAAMPDAPPRLRRRALELLGEVAGRDDIRELAKTAAEDPLLFGAPAVAGLRRLHRRGHFPGGADAPTVVDLALADHTISAAEIATVLFTCRHEALRALTAAAPEDPSWPRRLELMVALAGQGAGDLPVGAAVTELLPSAPDPAPFLYALRALRHQAAEHAVIAMLPRAPAAALHALQAVGGRPTVIALREGLGLSGPYGGGAEPAPVAVAAHLRPVRHRALELLWQLTDDPEQRQALLTRLTPRDLPGRIAADLGAPDDRELAVLSSDLDPGRPAEALCTLARNGGAGTAATIADLLLRIVSGLAASWEPGGPAGSRPADGAGPAAEPAVPHEVVAAVRGLGRRLHERGRIRPHCLLDAADGEAAGHALVAGIALDLLDRPGLRTGEQAILLDLLHQAPYPGTRARVHRLLRHRDRHVRKHAIALLTLDAEGADAQALSASLIALTTAGDAQTVRQALLALGHARAGWACHAIAACLDHPDMNVKKTAAGVLARAGTPVAVPRLLSWLGRHDNPGLRDALTGALRAILGDAYAATVLAAADRDGDERTRTLLLQALCGRLSARAVGALLDQGSPAGPALLMLIAQGRLRLGAGTAEELADRFAAHGIDAAAAAPAVRGDDPPDSLDAAVRLLADRGWNAETARRLVEEHERDPGRASADRLSAVRPMLGNWLDLAVAGPAGRGPVLRLTLRVCPEPWTAAEIETFTRSARVLTAGLTDLAGPGRDGLLAVLEKVAPRMPAAEALDLAALVRELPAGSGGGRSPLTLLRECGATLTRGDVENALAGVRNGPDPWRAEEGVLREAFMVDERPGSGSRRGSAPRQGGPEPAETREWRAALRAAARSPGALGEFRRDGEPATPGSRDRLDALIEVFPSADAVTREALLDWMVALQPIDAPAWTIAENAGRPAPPVRAPRPGDLDQPRSAALRDRLLAMLDAADPARRDAAARALLDWPEPEIRLTLLWAFLRGRVDLALTPGLARALNAVDVAELGGGGPGGARDDPARDEPVRDEPVRDEPVRDDALRERAARVAAHLDPPDVERLIPLLLRWWERGGPATRASAERALRRVAPDVLAEALSERLGAGAWGFLDLIAGTPLLRTPALAEARRRLTAEGRDDLLDRLVLVEGPLRHPEAAGRDAATLAALRDRPRPPAGPAGMEPPREELLELARTGRPEQVRRALSRLAEPYEGRPAGDGHALRDVRFEEVLAELADHPEARVRLHAHRIARKVLDRPSYLRRTISLLDDPQPDVVRSAVKTLSHAAYEPAVPAVVGLLTHSHPNVRRAAVDGLTLIGTVAVPALRHAAGRARPDRRRLYTAVLEKITMAAEG
ncbi:HEAT repeat domain-containing protein [Actinomadura sp. HBU206391]|uniref:HEAT repeat domain-containing protein n=1 Tax=Actinomadura sp. HBU206391 TaxID=2731692 RepID=UPI0016508C86|nr:HEAT repeat domain-containing protein [Actinomadura sp. HBU206391]MBC6462358.1 HEAT repeat domain-containing protein [Actinomadura sp. HBU206391]